MTKAGELNWDEDLKKSDNYQHIPTALWAADQHGGKQGGVDPLNKAEPKNKKGEEPYKPTNEEIAKAIMHNAPKQPTDEEMFGHLVVPEEQLEKAEKEWGNKLQGFYDAATTPINKSNQDSDWGSGKSFNSTLSEKERFKRNMHTERDHSS